ncbi:MAG: U32 family peptidase [Candidatus Aenigmarchaeota archaeon]|nr:U32 family peptidase [Candidatus Aenigmarchaeota archaeon]
MKQPRILSPLQDWKSLAAILNSSKTPDEVYFGIGKNNMRANANNFKLGDLGKLCSKLHENGIKANLATNIIYYDNELNKLDNLLEKSNKHVDAVIIHDIGAIQITKKHNLEFHISTQANVSNIGSVRFYEALGASRINLSRELSLKQIKEIRNKTKIELECFVHGAMCVAVSGRCFLSLYLYGKSANRGECIQPCRRAWSVRAVDSEVSKLSNTLDNKNFICSNDEGELIYDGRFMSPKDLCMIEHIPEIMKSSIDVFKIEGRMKDPVYIATTVKCYKEAVESVISKTYNKQKIQLWLSQLSSVYNRGFHTGFYFKHPGKNDFQLRDGSQAEKKKVVIGKVLNYFRKSGTCEILVSEITVNDDILISGNTTYLLQKIISLWKNGKSVEKAKGSATISVNKRVRKNDVIYIYR